MQISYRSCRTVPINAEDKEFTLRNPQFILSSPLAVESLSILKNTGYSTSAFLVWVHSSGSARTSCRKIPAVTENLCGRYPNWMRVYS